MRIDGTTVDEFLDTNRAAPQNIAAKPKVYRGRNGNLTLKNQSANALSFSLSVGHLNSDGKCSEYEIRCATIVGDGRNSNGRYEFQDSIDASSGFTIVLSGDSVDISNVHGTMGTGTGNRDLIAKIAGRYTAATNRNTSR
jgi:hypothetical protein